MWFYDVKQKRHEFLNAIGKVRTRSQQCWCEMERKAEMLNLAAITNVSAATCVIHFYWKGRSR